jgi:hypothetical protein
MKEGGDRRIDPDAALALVEQRQVFIEAVGGRAGRAVFLHQVHIHGDGVFPRLARELRLPLHVEQLAAVGIGHGGEGAMLSPQPGLPRRQMPYTPLSGSCSLAATSRSWFHVGRSSMLMPAF